MPGRVNVIEGSSDLLAAVRGFLLQKAAKAINSHGIFLLGVSGGSMAALLAQMNFEAGDTATAGKAQLANWHIFLVDERAVPLEHPDSNYKAITEAWPASLSAQWHPFCFNNEVPLEAAARDYEAQVRSAFKSASVGAFDLLLLGLGPDGHTASLFPDHPDYLKHRNWESTSPLVIPVTDAPKPPPLRISLSPKAINEAVDAVFVIVNSPGKTEVIRKIILQGDEQLPPTIVAPSAHWFLDRITLPL
jgi:6-phosphogluconolactonase